MLVTFALATSGLCQLLPWVRPAAGVVCFNLLSASYFISSTCSFGKAQLTGKERDYACLTADDCVVT